MDRTCARCGISIEHRDKRSRHCSPTCRDRDSAGSVKGRSRTCAHCGGEFVATKAPHVYCSALCRSRADVERSRDAYNRRNAERRARERGAQVGERFTHLEVFDRDGWICQLCLAPIDWNRSGRDPLAPALDHRVPLLHGGTHSLANVQASHFGCNAAKGARMNVILLPVPRARALVGMGS